MRQKARCGALRCMNWFRSATTLPSVCKILSVDMHLVRRVEEEGYQLPVNKWFRTPKTLKNTLPFLSIVQY